MHPTLDWSNQQIYHLWKDNVDPGATTLQWQSGMMRSRGAAPRNAEGDILDLETEWTGGLTAKTVKENRNASRSREGTLRRRRGDGHSPDRQHRRGDWRQLLVLAAATVCMESAGAPNRRIHRSRASPCRLRRMAIHPRHGMDEPAGSRVPSLQNSHQPAAIRRTRAPGHRRHLAVFAPTLSANEDGCDDLHWLDNSVFRFCCDEHDRCYEKAGCTSKSWWKVWTSWLCDFCNAEAVRCFLTGGLGSGGPGKLA